MAGKTHGDRILTIEETVYKMREMTTVLEVAVERLKGFESDTNRRNDQIERDYVALKMLLDELRRWSLDNSNVALLVEIGVLKEKVTRLESAAEKLSNRFWTFLPPIAAAVFGGLLVYYLRAR